MGVWVVVLLLCVGCLHAWSRVNCSPLQPRLLTSPMRISHFPSHELLPTPIANFPLPEPRNAHLPNRKITYLPNRKLLTSQAPNYSLLIIN